MMFLAVEMPVLPFLARLLVKHWVRSQLWSDVPTEILEEEAKRARSLEEEQSRC